MAYYRSERYGKGGLAGGLSQMFNYIGQNLVPFFQRLQEQKRQEEEDKLKRQLLGLRIKDAETAVEANRLKLQDLTDPEAAAMRDFNIEQQQRAQIADQMLFNLQTMNAVAPDLGTQLLPVGAQATIPYGQGFGVTLQHPFPKAPKAEKPSRYTDLPFEDKLFIQDRGMDAWLNLKESGTSDLSEKDWKKSYIRYSERVDEQNAEPSLPGFPKEKIEKLSYNGWRESLGFPTEESSNTKLEQLEQDYKDGKINKTTYDAWRSYLSGKE